ncbi:MAG: alpha/beta hydrolase [Lachnospiraceae bacterium]|nr:alpha/beta hydrolase [Lachnospiraceae bacterium]
MDIDLYYREAGEGEPLILLHGNGGDGAYFQEQMGPLSEHFRVIAIDTRGYGGSPRGSRPFTLAQFARDLEDFLEEEEIEKAHVLGFSDGGNIALLFALNSCARIDKLILNGANLFWDGLKPEVREEIEDTYDDAASELADLEQEEADPEQEEEELLTRRRELCVICERMKLMIDEPDIRPEQLAGITVPTLVIVGTDDMIDDAHSQLIADSLPDARMVRIEGDHFIAMKEPAAFNAAVLDFLLS